MQEIKDGDISVRLPVESSDEIGMLSSSFNDMCERLDDYIKRNYDAEIRRRTAELNALQAQINPHFLFNTIESIRMKAVEEGNMEIAQMLSLLGNMFRWSMRFDEKIVYIEDEVDYISSYLQLQRFRFSDKIDIDISVPDSLLDYGIPKLVLQPCLLYTSNSDRVPEALVLKHRRIIIKSDKFRCSRGYPIPACKAESESNDNRYDQ